MSLLATSASRTSVPSLLTTAASNVSAHSLLTTAASNVSAQSLLTTAASNVSAQSLLTTAASNVSAQSLLTTAASNVSAQSLLTTAASNVSAQSLLTTAASNVSAQSLLTTAASNVSAQSLLTTAASNVSERVLSVHDYPEKQIADVIVRYYVPVCVLLGLIGNSVSFCVLVMTSLRKTTTCLYMATIAFMDSVILVIDFILYANSTLALQTVDTWACGLILFVFYTTIHYDVLLVVAMTSERYVAVTFPLKAATMITTRRSVTVIVTLAAFSVAVNLHNLFTRTAVHDPVAGKYVCKWEGDLNELFLTKVYPWIDSTLYCFIPVTSLFVLNILIVRNLRKAAHHQRQLTEANTSKSTRQINQGQNQRQVTIMLMLVSFAFLLLSTPIAIQIIIQRYAWFPQTAHDWAVYALVHAIIDNLMYTNHTINFLLYCISGQRFRTKLGRLCCRRGRAKKQSDKRQLKLHSITTLMGSVDTISAITNVSIVERKV